MPRLTQSEIHSNFSTSSSTWNSFRSEVVGFYSTYPKSELDDHISREFNKKVRDLSLSSSLYLYPYDAGLRYTGNGSSFSAFTNLYLGAQLVAGNFVSGTTTRSEISGGSAAKLSANQGYFFLCHDSSSTVFVTDSFGRSQGSFVLTGATFTDAEAIFVTNESTPRVIVGCIGDNAASRTTKQLFIFDEPTVTGGDETIANDGSWIQVDFQYPATPLWAGGSNRGDAESMFVADDKIYIISKREAIPKLFSLPLQSSYSGTQTMAYEGEIYDIPDVTGVTPGNAVDATISSDELHILVKTYGQVWRWSRESTSTDIPTLLATAPTEMNYVGLANHPSAEPQGETFMFNHNDTAVYFISESGTGSAATNFPMFKSFVSQYSSQSSVTYQYGASSYTSAADTYVNEGINEGVNYGTSITFFADTNESDTRYGLLRFSDLGDSFPSNAVLFGAALDLYISSEGILLEIYQITNADKAWDESTVTWTSLGGITIGTDTPSTPCAVVNGIDGRTGDIQLAIDPSIISGWLNTPSTNLGFLLVCTDLDGLQISSKEATLTQRPKLTLQYNPDPNSATITLRQGADGYTAGEDTYWWQGGAGSSIDYSSSAATIISDVNVGDERFGYHKWGGLDSGVPAGATITSVEIDMYVNTEGQGFAMYQLLRAFDQTDSYDSLIAKGFSLDRDDTDVSSTVAASWPGDDGYVGAITVSSTDNLVSLVQSWVDTPSSNHGFLVVATHASDGQQIRSNEYETVADRPLLRITYTAS